MADSLKMRIENPGDIERALNRLSADPTLIAGIVRPAGKQAMKPVLETARALASEDTGILKKSLGSRAVRQRRVGGIQFQVGPRPGFRYKKEAGEWVKSKAPKRGAKPTDPKGTVYKDPQRYAHLREFGTKPHMVRYMGKQRVQHPGTAAKPFIRPAFDMHEESAYRTFSMVTIRGLERAWADKTGVRTGYLASGLAGAGW